VIFIVVSVRLWFWHAETAAAIVIAVGFLVSVWWSSEVRKMNR
jgi:hypothetical protein